MDNLPEHFPEFVFVMCSIVLSFYLAAHVCLQMCIVILFSFHNCFLFEVKFICFHCVLTLVYDHWCLYFEGNVLLSVDYFMCICCTLTALCSVFHSMWILAQHPTFNFSHMCLFTHILKAYREASVHLRSELCICHQLYVSMHTSITKLRASLCR